GRSRMKLQRIALAVALAIAAGPAAALGLGQIQVKSKIDQPLLAEIPIISSDPAELEQLQARLASPDTFARIGLEPPTGAAADLDFSVALDDRGRPVIRVTSNVPVRQPLVTFLVEVDWGNGRLVREYSALLDAPRTVAAPAQPPIQAPVVAPSNVIERPVAAAPVAPPEPEPETPAPTDDKATAAAPAEDAPAEAPRPDTTAIAPTPEPTPDPTPVARPAAPAIAERPDQVTVGAGQTLSQIATEVGPRGYTLDQTMLALLRANPDAFVRGNINLLKSGAVLRVPAAQDAAELAPAEAAVVVRDHLEQWRTLRAPAPQPAAVADAGAEPAPATNTKIASTASGRAARNAGARLEIVPPSSGAHTPGSRSGASAGGEGDMLRQELQETKETLAAKNAEVDELKSRVAELEKLQQDQAALLQLKDSKLAAAEQRLAQANTAKTAAPATTAQPAQPAQPQQASMPAWLWGGAALLVLGLFAWLFARRRAPAAESRRIYDTEALAAGIPKGGPAFDDDAPEEHVAPPPAFTEVGRDAAPPAASATHWTSAPASIGAAPTWHAGGTAAKSSTGAAIAEPETGAQQLELARAYLDMGDDDAARVVLREVLNGRDPGARDAAARLLRDL
ncbi:MAG TPA: FimV/HubP family polar landmark protein, partial [Lysobacter sp.]|nr:FimV/HubP family polar landmark protein [Lysobacter sp.]